MTPEQRVATTPLGERTACGTVYIHDKLGSVYAFPDANVNELRRVLPESGRIPESAPCLMIINATVSVLSIPMRNIEKVVMDDEVLWHA